MSEQILADINAAEQGLAALCERAREYCPNTHRAHRDLELAQECFEAGFIRLRLAVEAPDSPWVVRRYG